MTVINGKSYEWYNGDVFLSFCFVWVDLLGSANRNDVKHVWWEHFAILRGKCGKLAGLS